MKMLLLMLLVVPSIAFGADLGGIITPDLATGFYSTRDYSTDTNGNLVVCIYPANYSTNSNACLHKGKSAWRHVSAAVPAGKHYVGFKVVSGGYGYSRRQLEIYWR